MAALDRISIAAIGDTAEDLAEQASAAEAAGIDCIWTPELFRSSVTQATWLAAKTEKVGIGTGIAWAFTRSAFILAVTALDIDEMSGGRFRLGPRRRGASGSTRPGTRSTTASPRPTCGRRSRRPG